jgi:hypothetical protein
VVRASHAHGNTALRVRKAVAGSSGDFGLIFIETETTLKIERPRRSSRPGPLPAEANSLGPRSVASIHRIAKARAAKTGQNRVKPIIRSRHGHISHGYMKFTRKDVISSGARSADFISSDVRARQVEDRRLDAEGAGYHVA